MICQQTLYLPLIVVISSWRSACSLPHIFLSSITKSSSIVIAERSFCFLNVLPINAYFLKVSFSTVSRIQSSHLSLRRKVLPLRLKVSLPNKNLKLKSSLRKVAEGVISPSELSELSSAFLSSQYSALSLPELDFAA